tara:strand:+ start:1718 stop:1963 length:246 start_codon:yes stop_codon:yes gene_type:complete
MENKITEEELKVIQDQQNKTNTMLAEIGLLETQKHALLHDIAQLNEDINNFKEKLQKTYGDVNITISDGTYTIINKEEENV